MAVVSFTVCDICASPINDGDRIVVVYAGTLSRVQAGRAIVTFEDEAEAEPEHHHDQCHEATHSVAPAEEKGLVH